MKRREFMLVLSAAIAAAGPLRAQQKAMSVVGALLPFRPPANPATDLGRAASVQGMCEMGFVEGQNWMSEVRWAEDHYDRLPALAADLVSRKVDVIVTFGVPLLHSRRKTQPRRSRPSSPMSATRSAPAWPPVLPGQAATSPASATSPPS